MSSKIFLQSNLQQSSPLTHSYDDLPKEIIQHIMHFLSDVNKVWVQAVCKRWQDVYKKEFAPSVLFNLFSNGLANSTKIDVCSSSFRVAVNLNASQLILVSRQKGVKFLDKKSFIDKPILDADCCLRIKHKNIFLFGSHEGLVIGIDRKTGDVAFKFRPEDALTSEEKLLLYNLTETQKLKGFRVLTENPLTFLTVTKSGACATWMVIDKRPSCLACWHLFDPQKYHFSQGRMNWEINNVTFINDFLLVAGKTWDEQSGKNGFFKKCYSLKNGKKSANCGHMYNASRISCTKIFLENDGNDRIACFEFDGKVRVDKWQMKEKNGYLRMLGNPHSNSLLISNQQEILTVNPNSGRIISKIPYPIPYFETWLFQRYGSLLFIIKDDSIVLIDCKQGKSFEWSPPPQYRKPIFSGLLTEEGLWLSQLSQTGITEIILIKPAVSKLRFQKKELILEAEPSVSKDLPTEIQTNKESQKRDHLPIRISCFVLSLFCVLSSSFFIYFAIHHAINLSIGLSSTMLLTGLGAGILAKRAFHRPNLCH